MKIRTRHAIPLAALALTIQVANLEAQQPSTGTITGTVVDGSGKAIANVTVAASITAVAPQIVQPFTATTQTAADGSFSLKSLPAGSYQVCASVAGGTLVNSCQWGTVGATAAVQAGRSVALQPIAMKQGHQLHVRIDDPQGLLAANEGVAPGAALLVGVWSSNGLFVPMPISNKDSKGRDHQIYVPENAALQLSVFSAFFAMGDANGAALTKTAQGAPAQSFPFNLTSTDGPKNFTFRVIGKN